MGKNQGLKRLGDGTSRKLTNSELSRGYLFVTHDSNIQKIINPNDFEVLVNGKLAGRYKIDSSGRIFIGKQTLNYVGTKTLSFQVKNKKLHLSF